MVAALERAKQGDPDARNQVANFCFERFRKKIHHFYSDDPAVSIEDLEVTFWEGCWHHVPKADGRGDDFYHIAVRGFWRVGSEVRALARQTSHIEFDRVSSRDEDDEDQIVDRLAGDGDFVEVLINTLDAERRVQILTGVSLKPRAREALDIMLSGELGDPLEPGHNQRLAQAMGVSEQRASQYMRHIREEVGDLL